MSTTVLGQNINPIIDTVTGNILVQSGSEGIITGYQIDPGERGYIPMSRAFSHQKDRRLKLILNIEGNEYFLLYPEEIEIITELGLLKILMEGQTVEEVLPLTPTPRYRSDTFRPYAATIKLSNGLLITQIMDRASGILDTELEAEEM